MSSELDADRSSQLERILARRAKEGRVAAGGFGGGGGAAAANSTSTAPAPNPPPVQSPIKTSADVPASRTGGSAPATAAAATRQQQQSQAAAAAPSSADALRSGHIVFEDGSSSAAAGTGASGRGRNQQPASVSAAGAGSPGSTDPNVATALRDIQQQGRLQGEQLRSLQTMLDDLIHSQEAAGGVSPGRGGGAAASRPLGGGGLPDRGAGGGGGGGGLAPPPPRAFGRPGKQVSAPPANLSPTRTPGFAPPGGGDAPAASSPGAYALYQRHMADSRNQQRLAAATAGDDDEELAKSLAFHDAVALGLVVRPRSVTTSTGSRMVTFQKPSQNARGLASNPTRPITQRSFNHSNFGHRGMATPLSRTGSAGRRTGSSQRRGNPNRSSSAGASTRRGMSASVFVDPAEDSVMRAGGGGGGKMGFTQPGRARFDTIAKPFSSSILDVDSAVVLLTVGEWFYKLRVDVQAANMLGPAGWTITNCERRFVYLDTSTYILKWGNKRGGQSTLMSHYINIDQIVGVKIFAQNETVRRGDEQRIVYYLVVQIQEGGFYSRSRGSQRRLVVFATEMRDKADMWHDALQAIASFYRSRVGASMLGGATNSSD